MGCKPRPKMASNATRVSLSISAMLQNTPTWFDSASLARFPKASRDTTVDVVVVGGGITGLTAAYLLKKAGMKVVVIERERCGYVDTGSTTAHLTCVTDLRLQQLNSRFGAQAAKAVWDAGSAAIDQIVSIVRAEEIKCDFAWLPGYLHAPPGNTGTREASHLRREAKVAASLGINAQFEESVPYFELPGVRFPNQAIFHPLKYLSGLARAIPGGGSHIFEHSNADEIKERPLCVKTGGYRIRADYLVLATHTPLMGKTGLAPALFLQTKLSLYTSYAIAARVPAGVIPRACFWDTGDPYGYLRVERRPGYDYAIYGGMDHKTGQTSDTETRYSTLSKTFLKACPSAAIDHRWSGQVITTNDGLPLIGETAPRQFAATGYAGNGMTFGTLGAMMATDAALRHRNPWSELFDIHRTKVLGGTWNYLKENKDYPYYMVRDWLSPSEGKSLQILRKGQGKILSLKGKKVAASMSDDGKVSLCSPICTHLQCIVAWNTAERTWDCPCHGSRFKPNGQVISGPAEEPLAKIALD
jgi:glycine/D-amino acid oxidase-like deaminating enzyme/nitrite reductase/ring-hydroxylating ferredoxin subunit